ncbi:MAG: NUDIX domain-containing protein [Candidatus Paceibacterota bacterium]
MSEVIATVGLVLFKDDVVLLVRHGESADHLTGTYGLPSGRVEPSETPLEAAQRELIEETGLMVNPEDLVELPKLFEATIKRKDGTSKTFSWRVYKAGQFQGKIRSTPETTPEWVKVGQKGINFLPNVEDAIELALKTQIQS